jgi:hypothetical protein
MSKQIEMPAIDVGDVDGLGPGSGRVVARDEVDQVGRERAPEGTVGHVLPERDRVLLVVLGLHSPVGPEQRRVVHDLAVVALRDRPRQERGVVAVADGVEDVGPVGVAGRVEVGAALGPDDEVEVDVVLPEVGRQPGHRLHLRAEQVAAFALVEVAGRAVALHAGDGRRAARGGGPRRDREHGHDGDRPGEGAGAASDRRLQRQLDQRRDERHHEERQAGDAHPRDETGEGALRLAEGHASPGEAAVGPVAGDELAQGPEAADHDGQEDRAAEQARPDARHPAVGEGDEDGSPAEEERLEGGERRPGQESEVQRRPEDVHAVEREAGDQADEERASGTSPAERHQHERDAHEREGPHVAVGEARVEHDAGGRRHQDGHPEGQAEVCRSGGHPWILGGWPITEMKGCREALTGRRRHGDGRPGRRGAGQTAE